MTTHSPLPPSATDPRIGTFGALVCTATLFWIIYFTDLQPLTVAILLLVAYAMPVIILEILVTRVHRRPSTGLDWTRPMQPSPRRVLLKLLGLGVTLGLVIAGHVFFRLYTFQQLSAVTGLALILLPVAVVLTVLYIVVVDGRQAEPEDAYYELGAMTAGLAPVRFSSRLRDHAFGWAVKAFFLPIMLYYLAVNATRLDTIAEGFTGDLVEIVLAIMFVCTIVDLAIANVGYTMTMRLFDAHIRSPNRYLGGWLVTLVCYAPFNEVVLGRIFDYRNELQWHHVIGDYPALTIPWIAAIVALYLIHVWSKAVYGLRWSNLTHRGILTDGPYRFTKHPDYLTKSIFFWLTAVPFLTAADPATALTSTLALVVTNLIYFGRARMEEKHLSEDPDYVAYALAMNERSIFRAVARIVPALRYVPPGAEAPAPDRIGDGRLVPGE
jgi:protein-S-isoprenylcysteine O-methyltransferase Ste14